MVPSGETAAQKRSHGVLYIYPNGLGTLGSYRHSSKTTSKRLINLGKEASPVEITRTKSGPFERTRIMCLLRKDVNYKWLHFHSSFKTRPEQPACHPPLMLPAWPACGASDWYLRSKRSNTSSDPSSRLKIVER